VSHEGKGPDEPVASNETAAGRARNRRVEVTVQTIQVVAVAVLQSDKASSGMKAVATLGLRPGEEWPAEKPAKDAADRKRMPDYNAAWLQTASAGLAWLWPPENFNPPHRSPERRSSMIRRTRSPFPERRGGGPHHVRRHSETRGRHRGGEHLERPPSCGGRQPPRGRCDRRRRAGVERTTRIIHYSGSPVTAVLVPERSRLVADGKNPPVVAVRFLDKDGHPAREGILGEYASIRPTCPGSASKICRARPLTASTSDRLQYHVGDDGIALIELEPTTQSGEAVIRIPMDE